MKEHQLERKRYRQKQIEAVILLSGILLSGCQKAVTLPAIEDTQIETTSNKRAEIIKENVQKRQKISITEQQEGKV